MGPQVDKVGCDPSGGASPRIKCDEFGLSYEVNGTSVLIAMFSIAFGGQALGQIATAVEAMTTARKAIKSGVDVIKRVPVIDVQSDEGLKPADDKVIMIHPPIDRFIDSSID